MPLSVTSDSVRSLERYCCGCLPVWRWIFWLVRLQLPGGEKCWFEYDSRNLKPANASSSSTSET
jgi:hypothetical protein